MRLPRLSTFVAGADPWKTISRPVDRTTALSVIKTETKAVLPGFVDDPEVAVQGDLGIGKMQPLLFLTGTV